MTEDPHIGYEISLRLIALFSWERQFYGTQASLYLHVCQVVWTFPHD